MRTTYCTLAVTSIGGRAGRVRSADGSLDLQLGVPKDLGGPGGKTNPEELFAAAYAASFHSAVQRIAADTHASIGQSAVHAQIGLCAHGHDSGFMLVAELHVALPGADVGTAKEMVRLAHLVCPYSAATRDNMPVTLRVTPADGQQYTVSRNDHLAVIDHA
jgi:osmotically inducible protein OsmC